ARRSERERSDELGRALEHRSEPNAEAGDLPADRELRRRQPVPPQPGHGVVPDREEVDAGGKAKGRPRVAPLLRAESEYGVAASGQPARTAPRPSLTTRLALPLPQCTTDVASMSIGGGRSARCSGLCWPARTRSAVRAGRAGSCSAREAAVGG